MFQRVKYSGFDGHPDLVTLARRGTDVLASEIHKWREQIEVTWEAYPDSPAAIELTVALTLSIGKGTGLRMIYAVEFQDDELLRARIRRAWDLALGEILELRKKAREETARETVEV